MKNLTAIFLLSGVKVATSTNIGGFALESVPGHPNCTYLRFDFTHSPNKNLYFECEKEVRLLSFILSVVYGIAYPELKVITDKSGPRLQATDRGIRNPVILEPKDFDKIKKAYKKVKNMTRGEKKIFDFVARWIQKAGGSHNVYDQFMCYWIAFNFLYGLMHPGGEQEKIKEWVDAQCDNTYADQLFADFKNNKQSPKRLAIEYLAKGNLTLYKIQKKKKIRRYISRELLRAICSSTFNLDTLCLLVLNIYAVRCKLFHGDWSYLGNVKRYVGGAVFLLYEVIRRGLEKQCNFDF